MNYTWVRFDDYQVMYTVSITDIILGSLGFNDSMVVLYQRDYTKYPIIPYWPDWEQ